MYQQTFNPSLEPFSIGGQDISKGQSVDLQALARLLRNYGKQENGQSGDTKIVDGWAVPNSNMGGLNSLLGGLAQGYMMGGVGG